MEIYPCSIIHPSYVRTPMIHKLMEMPTFSERLLEADYVGDVVTRHILKGKSGQVFLPAHYSLVSGIRGWPTGVQEMLRGLKAHLRGVPDRSFV